MVAFVDHQPHPFKQYTICIRGVFLPAAGPDMAGSPLPAMMNVLDADGAVSPARAVAPAEDLRSRLTRWRRWRSRPVPGWCNIKPFASRLSKRSVVP